jgi:hypothetical protein
MAYMLPLISRLGHTDVSSRGVLTINISLSLYPSAHVHNMNHNSCGSRTIVFESTSNSFVFPEAGQRTSSGSGDAPGDLAGDPAAWASTCLSHFYFIHSHVITLRLQLAHTRRRRCKRQWQCHALTSGSSPLRRR